MQKVVQEPPSKSVEDGSSQNVYDKLYALYSALLFKIFYHLTGDAFEAEDLVSETFANLYRKKGTDLSDIQYMPAYLKKIGKNGLISKKRKKQPTISSYDDTTDPVVIAGMADDRPDPQETLERAEEQMLFLKMIHHVMGANPYYEMLLVLCSVYSIDEIAPILGQSLDFTRRDMNVAMSYYRYHGRKLAEEMAVEGHTLDLYGFADFSARQKGDGNERPRKAA